MKLLMPHLKICGGFSFFRCWLQAFFYVCCGCCRGLAFRKCLIRCLLGLSWPALDFTSQFRSKCCLCRVWKNEAHFQLALPLQIQHPTLDMVDFLSKSLHLLNVECIECPLLNVAAKGWADLSLFLISFSGHFLLLLVSPFYF